MTSAKTLALLAAILVVGAGFVAATAAYAQSGKKSARAPKPAALGKSSRAPKWGDPGLYEGWTPPPNRAGAGL
jgi:hypothetical protein